MRGDNYCLRNKRFPLKWVKARAHNVWKTSLCSCGRPVPEADHSCPQMLHKFSLRCLWNKLATKGLHPEQTLPMTSLSFSTGAFKIFKKCVWLFCLCITCLSGTCRRAKRRAHHKGLQLQMVATCLVGEGNWTQVLWKGSQYSQLLNDLSSPHRCIVIMGSVVVHLGLTISGLRARDVMELHHTLWAEDMGIPAS